MKKAILNNFQKKALKIISASALSQLYVWAGGTALAYQFKHRLSEDLDFLSETLLPDEHILTEINHLQQKLKIVSVKTLKKQNRFIFELNKDKQNLKLEFVYFPFPALKPHQSCRKFSRLKIISLLDMAVNKLFALYERAEAKDVFDLYFLLKKKKYSLNALIKGIDKKFGVQIDKTHLYAQAKKALANLKFLKPLILKKVKLQTITEKINKIFKTSANKYLLKALIF